MALFGGRHFCGPVIAGSNLIRHFATASAKAYRFQQPIGMEWGAHRFFGGFPMSIDMLPKDLATSEIRRAEDGELLRLDNSSGDSSKVVADGLTSLRDRIGLVDRRGLARETFEHSVSPLATKPFAAERSSATACCCTWALPRARSR